MTSRGIPLGATLFFALLVTTLVAAVLVIRERTPDLVLEVTAGLPCSVDPDRLGRPDDAEISFFVRESDDDATVGIVDGREELVRTLDDGVALEAGETFTYSWDGRTDAATRARPGRYRLLVELPSHERTMIWPRRISLSSPTTAPPCGSPEGEG